MDKKAKIQYFAEFIIDLVALLVSSFTSVIYFRFLFPRIGDYSFKYWFEYFGLLIVSFLIVFLGFHKNLDIHVRSKFLETINLLKNDAPVYILFITLLAFNKSPVFDSRLNMVVSCALFFILSALGRYALKKRLLANKSSNAFKNYVGVLTTIDRAENLVKKIKTDWSAQVTGVALLDNFVENERFTYDSKLYFGSEYAGQKTMTKIRFPHIIDGDIPVIATDVRFIDWIRSAPLDEVYIDLPYLRSADVQEIVEELESMGVTVHLNVPTLDKLLDESEFNNIKCRSFNGHAIATFSPSVQKTSFLIVKRLFDLVGGLLGALVSIPVILITAIPLLIESPGPLIFKQERVGKNGRIFKIYKLRSMYMDAEERKKELMEHNKMDGLMFKMDNDPRITKVGRIIRKLSIDELPQFFNVIKGDMSLIGTRPPTVNEFEQYENRHKRRLSMRPGITGMWQVSGRSDIQDFEEVVKLDCEYIDNCSIWLDIKILFKTVMVVLTHKGAE